MPDETASSADAPEEADPGPPARAPEQATPEGLQARVAQTLKQLRKERGWTLEELAGRSGVSRAMLSQIEARKTNPTIAVLWKISTAFGLTFSALLGEQERRDVMLLPRAQMQVLSSHAGRYRSTPLFPRSAGRKAELYELRLEPGTRSDAPAHPPGTRENLVAVQGGLTVWVAGAPFELAEADAIEFAADVPHAYENRGTGPFLGYEVVVYR
jgi:XRE family transcriptional regulator, regulator of sulfur utilization